MIAVVALLYEAADTRPPEDPWYVKLIHVVIGQAAIIGVAFWIRNRCRSLRAWRVQRRGDGESIGAAR